MIRITYFSLCVAGGLKMNEILSAQYGSEVDSLRQSNIYGDVSYVDSRAVSKITVQSIRPLRRPQRIATAFWEEDWRDDQYSQGVLVGCDSGLGCIATLRALSMLNLRPIACGVRPVLRRAWYLARRANRPLFTRQEIPRIPCSLFGFSRHHASIDFE